MDLATWVWVKFVAKYANGQVMNGDDVSQQDQIQGSKMFKYLQAPALPTLPACEMLGAGICGRKVTYLCVKSMKSQQMGQG